MDYDESARSFLITDSAQDVIDRTKEKWHLGGRFPLPKSNWQTCGLCGSDDFIIRQMSFHKRKNATHPFRCDVFFKCCGCGNTPTCGVAIPEEMFRKHDNHQNRHIRRHEILKDINGDDIDPWSKND